MKLEIFVMGSIGNRVLWVKSIGDKRTVYGIKTRLKAQGARLRVF
jgi:hypothetical protein